MTTNLRSRIDDLWRRVNKDPTEDVGEIVAQMDATVGGRPLFLPTARWTLLVPHVKQRALWTSSARFKVVPAGRRSGKTELAKRKVVREAVKHAEHRYVVGAPTHAQAVRIFWKDLKKLTPKDLIDEIRESDKAIHLANGSEINVFGMDVPERAEGSPIDGLVLDEYGNMLKDVWDDHLRPALSTRGRAPGWAWLIGVPEGRNHYHDLWLKTFDGDPDWAGFTWFSEDILAASEIEAMKRDLDDRVYRQEMQGEFVDFAGRAYYGFTREMSCVPVQYDPRLPLVFCFDFNVDPGVCVVCQEQQYLGARVDVALSVTACVDEVYIPRDSNTERVCNELMRRYPDHVAGVSVYGDATGGARGTAKTDGSDIDIILRALRHYAPRNCFASRNPSQRARINAMNARLKSAAGVTRILINQQRCSKLVRDLEGVLVLEGTSGELDKSEPTLTHISDGFGYYVAEKYPVVTSTFTVTEI